MSTLNILATDQLQTPLSLLGAGGQLRSAYTPYGYRPAQSPSPLLGFTGQLRELELGWYLLGNGYRAYNPVLMRFHSPDVEQSPFGKGGINAYAYCGNDPVNHSDHSGRAKNWVSGHVAAYVGGGAVVVSGGLTMGLGLFGDSNLRWKRVRRGVRQVVSGGAIIAGGVMQQYDVDHGGDVSFIAGLYGVPRTLYDGANEAVQAYKDSRLQRAVDVGVEGARSMAGSIKRRIESIGATPGASGIGTPANLGSKASLSGSEGDVYKPVSTSDSDTESFHTAPSIPLTNSSSLSSVFIHSSADAVARFRQDE